MAVGDVVSGLSAITNGNTLTIQPTTGEWVIHNVYYGGAVEFYVYNGATNNIKFDSDTTFGARLGAVFHLNNTQYLQIKNVSGGAINIAYDGVQTK